ncbi:MAG: glycerate kinase [Parvibaculum sp.]|nr:glycerate kinase [Parvibaculum sp.]
MTRAYQQTRARLRRLYDAAVEAALPAHCLPPHLPDPPKADAGRLVIFAIGKAAASMTAAAEDCYDRKFPGTHIEGMALTRYGHGVPTRHVEVVEAAHPVPDEAGAAASKRLMRMAEWLGPHDLALVLLSGGGSALTALPVAGISLADEQLLTRALVASGLPIADINCVRKHISRIKGGRLAEAMHPARSVTLAISDVAGDDPSTIASGPTVPDTTAKARALTILDELAGLPPHIRAALEAAPETPKPDAEFFAHATYKLVASGSQSLIAAARLARSEGYETLVLGDNIEGEARVLAREHAGLVRMAQGEGRKLAIISGGEAGVTFGDAAPPGDVGGKGGPSQEYALALAVALKGAPGVAALAGDTDGIDGGAGAATDPAGAFVLPDTASRADTLGLDAPGALDRHDSGSFFAALDDLFVTGPSYTNVNDFRVILVDNEISAEENPS